MKRVPVVVETDASTGICGIIVPVTVIVLVILVTGWLFWKNKSRLLNQTFTLVNAEARDYKVYRYVQKRANDLIVRCQEVISTSNDITPCTDSILLASAETPNETINSFFQKFGNMQKRPIRNMNAQVAVFIGENESFYKFCRDVSQDIFICRINTQSQSTSQTGGICRKDWGFECLANDLTEENISTHIDDVLEQFAMEKLANAANSLPKQGENVEEILAEVKELFSDIEVRMPDWLVEWEPSYKSKELRKRLEKISQKILEFPAVFACKISQESLEIMIHTENESHLEDVIECLRKFKLSSTEFDIRLVEITPLSGDIFRSGDPIQVLGSNAPGTLGGFAEFKTNGEEQARIVAISAEHVLSARDTDAKEIQVNNETFGKTMDGCPDIAIGEVTAPMSKCNLSFRTEDGKEAFAEIYPFSISDLMRKRVHLWGAKTSLGKAKISNIGIAPKAGKFMVIEKDPTTIDKSTVVLSSSRELLPKTRRADTGFEIAPKYTKGMEHWGLPRRGFPAKRSLQEKCERRKFNYNIRGIRKDSDEISVHFEHFKNTVHIKRVLDAKDIIFVNASAANFEVYSFLQKSTKIIRTKYQTEINASHDIVLWPDRILIAAKGTDSAFLHKFKLHDTRGTFQSKIAFFTGEDDNLVDVFCREALPETTICWIKPTGQTGSDRGEIIRKDWGFQCDVNDLSNNTTITECIDDVLQHLVLDNLARAAEAIQKQGKRTEEILTEVKELFILTKVPMPKWLTVCKPNSKSIAVLKKISQKVLTLPSVFACDVTDTCINIMIRREKESSVKDLVTKLETFGLSNKEFNIHFKEI